ncbi:MAG TPA: hypothetical protein VKV77_09360 [Methylovirgula sp.]|nr:hypothetical protein [Methylovirgula sp.]
MKTQDRLEAVIAVVVKDDHLHARWLNTFSFLEYVGFRKIVKSQRAEVLNRTLLMHALEEGRHALLLKKLAVKLGGKEFDFYRPQTMLCFEAAKRYFQDLDHGCDAKFAHLDDATRSKLVYLYVTWLIERRALDFYGRYKDLLGASDVAPRLNALLAEEVGHLRAVEAGIAAGDPDHAERSAEFEALESDLYNRFIDALAEEVAPSRAGIAI